MSSPNDPGFVPPPFRPLPQDVEYFTFKGGCLCGKHRFEVVHPSLEVRLPISCNCTWCTKNPMYGIYVDDKTENFRLTETSEADLGGFTGRKFPIRHQFCTNCSSNIFWRGAGKVGVNARLFDDVDVREMKVELVDGKSS